MFEEFVSKVRNLLNPCQILTEQDEVARQVENVTSFHEDVLLILYPETENEVRQIVLAASTHKVSLHHCSTGKSWGFGSKLSTQAGLFLVDLHRMNKIIEVNEEFGYAIFEPGAMQFRLFNYLKDNGSKFFSDTIGSAKNISIIGNALDKGAGYNMERYKQLLNLEIVLGDGRIFKTSFGRYADCKATYTFPEGIDLSYLRMCLQSNFGINTGPTIELRRRPEQNCIFIAFLKSELIACGPGF